MGSVQNAKIHSSTMRSYMCIIGYRRLRVERTTMAILCWYTPSATRKSTRAGQPRTNIVQVGRTPHRVPRGAVERLERHKPKGFRAVLRGLRGSNALSATRLLLTWNHTCAYCDTQHVPLQLDHVQARSRNGSNRVSNLVMACESCYSRKGNQDIREFL